MSIKQVQSNAAASVQKEERVKVSKSTTSAEGTSTSTNTTVETSDAVSVSIGSSQREAKGPPSHSYGAQHGRGATNFKKIDLDGDKVLSREELLAAQEIRQGEGKNTKFIDRALANYDALTESSGNEGISRKEFYKPYRPETLVTPEPGTSTEPTAPIDTTTPTDSTTPTDTTLPTESELPLVEVVPPSDTVLLDIVI